MPETEDIVTRLRQMSRIGYLPQLGDEAADTIATLRDELKAVTAHCDGLVDEAATLRAEVEGLRADAERLAWMSTHEAWIGWNREGDMCRVWKRSEDVDDFTPEPVCGWSKFFDNPRAAIDAAKAG